LASPQTPQRIVYERVSFYTWGGLTAVLANNVHQQRASKQR